MNIAKLLNTANQAAAGLNSNNSSNVNIPQDIDGQTIYRNVYYLHFKIDPSADGIVIDNASSRLEGYFYPYTHHLIQSDTSFQEKSWEAITEDNEASPNLVKINLTHPWRLSAVNTGDDRGVEVLRLDGDAISPEPTVSGNANTTFGDKFIGQNFALRKVNHIKVTSELLVRSGAQENVQKQAGRSNAIANGNLSPGIDLTRTGSNSNAIVATHGIKSIALKSYPTGPRILIGKIGETVTSETSLLSVWQEPGEQTQTPVYLLSEARQKEAFSIQLQKACNDYFTAKQKNNEPPGQEIFLPIVFESDTPVKLKLTAIDIVYHLVRNHFDNISEKENVKFSGNILEIKTLTLTLPANSIIKKAHVAINPDFNGVFKLNNAADLTTALNRDIGVKVTPDNTVSRSFTLSDAASVDIVALALMPLEDGVKISVQIIEDFNNGPNGAVLANASIQISQEDQQQWMIAKLDRIVLLDAKNYWISVCSQEGELLWLAEDTATEVCIVLMQTSRSVTRKIKAVAPLYRLGFSQSDQSLHNAVKLKVGGAAAKLVETNGAMLNYDFSEGLVQLPGSGLEDADVCLICASKGSVTVYSPDIVFDV